jgi:hypothetical protein
VIKPTSLAPQHQLGLNSRTCAAAEFLSISHADSFYVGEDVPLVLLRCVEGDAAGYGIVARDPTLPGDRSRVLVAVNSDGEQEAVAPERICRY